MVVDVVVDVVVEATTVVTVVNHLQNLTNPPRYLYLLATWNSPSLR
jgi:hypothetical protein